jgi:hypothetical protein
MSIVRATVTLRRSTGLPEDSVMNVFHFAVATDPGVEDPDFDIVTNQIRLFYDAFGTWVNASINRSAYAHSVDFRVVHPGGAGAGDDTESVLLGTRAWGFADGPTTSTCLPAECASCLSFVGSGAAAVPEESGATRPRSRHRGRAYIGPFIPDANVTDATTKRSEVASALRGAICTSASVHLVDGCTELAGWILSVYSPTNGVSYPVEMVWMDDAWDIIRSRGEQAVSRLEIAVGV